MPNSLVKPTFYLFSYFLDSARAQDISYRIENTFIPAALHNNFNLVNNRMIHVSILILIFN